MQPFISSHKKKYTDILCKLQANLQIKIMKIKIRLFDNPRTIILRNINKSYEACYTRRNIWHCTLSKKCNWTGLTVFFPP